MTIPEVQKLTQELLTKHIPNENWNIQFFEMDKTIGATTHYLTRSIQFDIETIKICTYDQMQVIIKHEVAHVIAFTKYGCTDHSKEWQDTCKVDLKEMPILKIVINKMNI
jgi:predicted SprT family Zn-dependent metalloprotease